MFRIHAPIVIVPTAEVREALGSRLQEAGLSAYREIIVATKGLEIAHLQFVFGRLTLAVRRPLSLAERTGQVSLPNGRVFARSDLTSQKPTTVFDFEHEGKTYNPLPRGWRMTRLAQLKRLFVATNSLRFVQFLDDFAVQPYGAFWDDTGTGSSTDEKLYVVQTGTKVVQRCMLMCTDPGDLVLDPTCGSGTTAYVAEQWGQRWITIDTSPVPLALARQRLLTATFPYYKLKTPPAGPAGGFVYERKQNRNREEIAGRGRKGRSSAILVLNDEAHHTYRRGSLEDGDPYGEEDEITAANVREYLVGAATASGCPWTCRRRRSTSRVVVMRWAGLSPWVVSDFSLLEAIEAGLVKVPQLPTEDGSGEEVPRYFNVWRWVQKQAQNDGHIGPVTATEVMRYATAPIVTLAASWRETLAKWVEHFRQGNRRHDVPPVFIIVCKDTTIAKALHAWLAEGDAQYDAGVPEF